MYKMGFGMYRRLNLLSVNSGLTYNFMPNMFLFSFYIHVVMHVVHLWLVHRNVTKMTILLPDFEALLGIKSSCHEQSDDGLAISQKAFAKSYTRSTHSLSVFVHISLSSILTGFSAERRLYVFFVLQNCHVASFVLFWEFIDYISHCLDVLQITQYRRLSLNLLCGGAINGWLKRWSPDQNTAVSILVSFTTMQYKYWLFYVLDYQSVPVSWINKRSVPVSWINKRSVPVSRIKKRSVPVSVLINV